MDAWRIGSPGNVTTYDLEGLETSVEGDGMTIAAGEPATLHGAVVDSGSGEELTDAELVLEVQKGADWAPVQDCAGASCTVRPETTTTYRWRFDGLPRAEGSTSEPFTVTVRKAPAEQPSTDPSPSKEASPSARPSPSKSPSPTKKPSPSDKPTANASSSPKPSSSSSPSLAAPSATQSSAPAPSSSTTSPAG
jgi:hypothetical protein